MGNNYLSYSLTACGNFACSGKCKYCSSGSPSRTEERRACGMLDGKFRRDWNKVRETIHNDKQYKNTETKRLFSFDLWRSAGNSLDNMDEFKEIVDFCQHSIETDDEQSPLYNHLVRYDKGVFIGTVYDVKLHTSDNGLQIGKNLDFLRTNHIGVQLSHDGYGEWVRLDEDPLEHEDKYHLAEAVKAGVLDWINCTLSFYNYSFYKNIRYFENWRLKNGLLYLPLTIKLNHSYPSDYEIKEINVKGHWQDGFRDDLVGKPIGNWGLHNDHTSCRVDEMHCLNNYMNEFIQLYLDIKKSPKVEMLRPYKNYILSQAERYKTWLADKDHGGACRSFQRGVTDSTFVIDTMGRYSQCNLLDADHKVDNPTCQSPSYCKDCQYNLFGECNSCGSVRMESHCEYYRLWADTLMTIKRFNDIWKQR